MVFSGGISAFVLPIITRASPDGTALTFPFSHADAPGVAIQTAKTSAHDKISLTALHKEYVCNHNI